jgi:purine-binding chemotaxis protein CheW
METTTTDKIQYLTFRLAEEMFALDVSQVREILDMTTITKVPRSADFMRGVINVRGSVVPVVDMRIKFDMPKFETTTDTRIVVMEICIDGEVTILGALADSVHDVMEMEPDQIEPAPKIGAKWRTEFIKGLGKQNDEFIIILDIDQVFSSDELAIIQAADAQNDESAGKIEATVS